MQKLSYRSYGATDVGKKREINEDYFLIDDKKHLFIVADGMGGHSAGEEASRISSVSFMELFSPVDNNIKEHLIDCTQKVNKLVHTKSESDTNLNGMGTTLVACFCSEDTAYLCHAGDSRAYLFRDGSLIQLTEDHSVVAVMVRQGYITLEEAEDHPMKNRITKAVGILPDIDPDVTSSLLKKGDILMLCSDGLTNMVKREELLRIFGVKLPLEETGKKLIQTANNNGGHDNITIVLIEAN